MQTCRESKRDRGLVYVCVVVVAGGGGAVKGNSEARNGICYWDYRTTSSPSQTIANFDWDPRANTQLIMIYRITYGPSAIPVSAYPHQSTLNTRDHIRRFMVLYLRLTSALFLLPRRSNKVLKCIVSATQPLKLGLSNI